MRSALHVDEWSGPRPGQPRARLCTTTLLATLLAVPVILVALVVALRVAVKAASMLMSLHSRKHPVDADRET